MATTTWFDSLLDKFKIVGTDTSLTIAGVNVSQAMCIQIIGFLISNRAVLEAAGKEAFTDFLHLWGQGSREAAFQALLASQGPDAVIADIVQDTNADKIQNDLRDNFEKAMLQFTFAVVEQVGIKVLIAALI
jgi:hypothetical protein